MNHNIRKIAHSFQIFLGNGVRLGRVSMGAPVWQSGISLKCSRHTMSCARISQSHYIPSCYLHIWLKSTKSGPVGLEKLTFHTFHHDQCNGCFKHLEYRLSMSKRPCHTIIFSFRVAGPQSWVLRVTKVSRFLRYPQYTSHLLYFFHVGLQMNTYNLL